MLLASASELERLRNLINSPLPLAFDTEAWGPPQPGGDEDAMLDATRAQPAGFSIGDAQQSWYVDWFDGGPVTAEAKRLVAAVLADPKRVVFAHNWKFDLAVCRNAGWNVDCRIADTLLMGWLLNRRLPGKAGLKLKPLVAEYLGHEMATWEDTAKGRSAREIPPEVLAPYAAADALWTARLALKWVPELTDLDVAKVFWELEMPVVRVLRHMEDHGAQIDRDYLEECRRVLGPEAAETADAFYWLTGAEIASPQQVSRRLYDELGWWPTDVAVAGKSGVRSTNKDAMKAVLARCPPDSPGYKAADLRMRYQAIAKLTGTYLPRMLAMSEVDGRLRSDFLQHGTDTGRLSSSSPLLTMPKPRKDLPPLRRAVVAAPGWQLACSDYSQIELRVLAHFSGDPSLIENYRQGGDLHQRTAERIGSTRDQAKTVNFAVIYGAYAKRLSRVLGIDQKTAARYIGEYFAAHGHVKAYTSRMAQQAKRTGMVRTLTKRFRRVDGIGDSDFGIRGKAERAAANTPIQGTACDIIKLAMRNLHRTWASKGVLGSQARIIIQVHDELVCELRNDFAAEGTADIKSAMEGAVELKVPLVAEPKLAATWLEAK